MAIKVINSLLSTGFCRHESQNCIYSTRPYVLNNHRYTPLSVSSLVPFSPSSSNKLFFPVECAKGLTSTLCRIYVMQNIMQCMFIDFCILKLVKMAKPVLEIRSWRNALLNVPTMHNIVNVNSLVMPLFCRTV